MKLDLFANIRPARSRLGLGLTGKPVDLVIVRECTEGFYADRNMFEDAYLNSAEFAKALVAQRADQLEFLKAVGIVK